MVYDFDKIVTKFVGQLYEMFDTIVTNLARHTSSVL